MWVPIGESLQRSKFFSSRAYASLQAGKAMISTLASLTSAKPMTPLTGLLLGNFSPVWDFLQRCYSSSLIKDLHDNTMCAMQAEKGRQGSWFQVSTGFKQGNVNAPLFFNVFLDSICRYIESKAGELGLRLPYNIDGHLTGRRRPNGSMSCCMLMIWSSLGRAVSRCGQCLRLCTKHWRTGVCR